MTGTPHRCSAAARAQRRTSAIGGGRRDSNHQAPPWVVAPHPPARRDREPGRLEARDHLGPPGPCMIPIVTSSSECRPLPGGIQVHIETGSWTDPKMENSPGASTVRGGGAVDPGQQVDPPVPVGRQPGHHLEQPGEVGRVELEPVDRTRAAPPRRRRSQELDLLEEGHRSGAVPELRQRDRVGLELAERRLGGGRRHPGVDRVLDSCRRGR